MCLAIPCKIIEIKKDKATVQGNSHTHEVSLSLVKNAGVGDYLLVHGDMALNKIEKNEALRIIKMVNNLNNNHD